MRSNLALLERARGEHPDAFVIYKPHPDVLSRGLPGAIEERDALRLCDRIETTASLPQCLDVADHVHTLTSLVGFEALVRGKQVFVYGQPFYSGWGLTRDDHPVERRTRNLSIDELVAGTLVLYPRYLDLKSFRFASPEDVLEVLRRQRDEGQGEGQIGMSRARRWYRLVRQTLRGVTDAQ